MQTTTVENGVVVHRYPGDYALLYKTGKLRARFKTFDEMWDAWEKLNLPFLHWRHEITQKSTFTWVDERRCPLLMTGGIAGKPFKKEQVA